jgi:DNA-binding CsgD family transcriptional regulator
VNVARWYALAALGQRDLGLGSFEAAISRLEEVQRLLGTRDTGHPVVIESAADLFDAYVHVGRVDDARRQLRLLVSHGSRSQSQAVLAVAYRCEGVLAERADLDGWFELALALHQRAPIPFDTARTQLWYGERLRRARRKNAARVHLQGAWQAFDQLGARPWAERARAEIGALGIRARSASPPTPAALTPQEFRVAMAVSQGATNREVSAVLLLSPRTIEAHLSRVYRKLDIRSRTELAALLAREGPIGSRRDVTRTATWFQGSTTAEVPQGGCCGGIILCRRRCLAACGAEVGT